MPEFAREVLGSLANNVLSLILMPTEACNFRCTYCYEDHRRGRMPPAVVRGLKKLLSVRAGDLDCLDISWFGGEPLLARDIMEDVLEYVQSLLVDHPRMRFRSNATTNGFLLTRPLFERLLMLGITGYQVSFDGPREWHDRKRILANGGGSYDRLWQNLKAIRTVRGSFTIMVRLHVDGDNRSALPRFVQAYERDFGDDPRFRLFVRGLSRLGGWNDAALNIMANEEVDSAVGCLERGVLSRHLAWSEVHAGTAICYASRANCFVVRSDGRLNKCTIALERPENQIGVLCEDGRLKIENDRTSWWLRGLFSGDAAELRCPLSGLREEV